MASKREMMDVESQQRSPAGRGRRLDLCLVLSVMVLFAGVVSLAVAGILVVQELQSNRVLMSKVIGGLSVNMFKKKDAAYLQAVSSEVKNRTMRWTTPEAEASVSSNFEFNSKQHSLKVKQAGKYFMFVDLTVSCNGSCGWGVLRVEVQDKLSCEVTLPQHTSSEESFNIQKNCWAVTSVSADTKLLFSMSLPQGQAHHWRLGKEGTSFGMFLVNE